MKKKTKETKNKNEKQEARHKRKQGDLTQGVFIPTNLHVSATKQRRGPCHTICDLLPALVGNGIKCHCCRCRAPPPREQIKENQTKLPGLGGCSNSGSTYWSNRYHATRSTISFLHSSTPVSIRLPHRFPPTLPLSSLLASSVVWRSQLLSASSLYHLVMKHSAVSATPRYHFHRSQPAWAIAPFLH